MSIFNGFISLFLRFKQIKPFEETLKKGNQILDKKTISEVQNYIKSQITPEGGFMDRAGNPDIYYSLFGYFLTEAFQLKTEQNQLKTFVKKTVNEKIKSDVHLFCGAILYSKLIGKDKTSVILTKKIKTVLSTSVNEDSGYIWFLGILALFYQEEYMLISSFLNKFKKKSSSASEPKPCTLVATDVIMRKLLRKEFSSQTTNLKSFYHTSGGFVALQKSPVADLLTTAVVLFSLNFVGDDLTLIKPDCLDFVDSLYKNGGFIATPFDKNADIEYTFYGLLALGSLNN